MNRRTTKVVQLHESLAVVLPKDWTRGMEIQKGDSLELTYYGEIRIRTPKDLKLPTIAVVPERL